MKHILYKFGILSALVIALAVSLTNPSGVGKADTSNADASVRAGEGTHAEVIATAPVVASIVRSDPNPTNADIVEFKVTFSEPVKGVDAGDFAPVVRGIGFALVTEVRGSGKTYHVSVFTGYGDGVLGLDLVDRDTITNASWDYLGGVGMYNGNFTGGEAYAIVRSAQ